LLATITLSDNPCCTFINDLPQWFFLLVHVALFLIGAFFALRAFASAENNLFGWGFALFALSEISYLTYHVNLTLFLFAHTISEVLDVLAFILIFAGLVRAGVIGRGDASRRTETTVT
jgi:hypothetical protein